ncbi:hypothetical protein H4R34_002954 [Dimargaris verticillata]|uniref:Non-haem dioxygenase N-terminal domain-containing protein n=1 Tax=Dimargaris verticillata TaxID=2761393 RepID=A0A9W8B5I8_9FUNG|nr:hypothetical protein H4R34_002954 [Dimargaris verticillata]
MALTPPGSSAVEKTADGAVVVDYAALDGKAPGNLSAAIEEAFGNHSDCLGLIIIRNVPQLSKLQTALLGRAPQLAHLPLADLQALEHPPSKYMFGWSHGKEVMNGHPDLAKGSFYANPTCNHGGADPNLQAQYPEYYAENLWPADAAMPHFRTAFEQLGQLIVHVGGKVAIHCDHYLTQRLSGYQDRCLQRLIHNSDTIKARLLHYFAATETSVLRHNVDNQPTQAMVSSNDKPLDSWCGWHLDHSCLTGLTPAKYFDIRQLNHPTKLSQSLTTNQASALFTPCPDPAAGLYVKSRAGNIVKVTIPDQSLAFQTGEALEILSGGFLRATPHCVRGLATAPGPRDAAPDQAYLSRNTMAVFIQPAIYDELKPGYTFAQFTKDVLHHHYG